MRVVVHHLEMSRSHRILWLLEELGAPYEIRRYARDPKTFRADPALRQVHPLGRAPIVEVDGAVLAESGAILEGLLDRLGDGGLRPAPGTDDFDRYRFFLHYAEGSVMPPLLVSLIFGKVVDGAPFLARPLLAAIKAGVDARYTRGELENHFGFIEGHLGRHPWFAGAALSAADIQMIYPVAAGPLRAGVTAASHPNTVAWLARVQERPAYRRALERGGPLFP